MQIGFGAGLSRQAGVIYSSYAIDLNGTDEFMTRALPVNVLTSNNLDYYSSGSMPGINWASNGATWNQTGITGQSGTYCIKLDGPNANIVFSNLVQGKKYKLRIRYYGNNALRVGSSVNQTDYFSFSSTTQWNTKVVTFTATSMSCSFSVASGTSYIDYLSFTPDWKLDLNESHELIKHSKNRDFELTGTEKFTAFSNGTNLAVDNFTTSGNGFTASGNATGSSGYYDAVVTNNLGLNEGDLVRIEFYIEKRGSIPIILSPAINNTGFGYIETYFTITTSGRYIYETFITADNSDFLQFSCQPGTPNDYDYTVSNFSAKVIPNLITNGTFSGGTTGFASNGQVEITSGNRLRFTDNGVSTASMYFTGFAPRANRRYRLTFETYASSASDGKFGIIGNAPQYALNNPIFSDDVGVQLKTPGKHTVTFKADINGDYFGFFLDQSSATNDYVEIDNVHICEIPEWTGTGNHTLSTTTIDKYAGTGSLYISASGAGDSSSNYVSLPYTEIDTLVSGNKYTIEGFVKVDPTSLTYGANLLTGDNSTFTTSSENWFNIYPSYNTMSLITGSGFSGNALRLEVTSSNSSPWRTTLGYQRTFEPDKIYKVTGKYRSSNIFSIGSSAFLNYSNNSYSNNSYPANTGSASPFVLYVKFPSQKSSIQFNSSDSNIGGFLEIDDVSIQEATIPILTAQLGTKSVTYTPTFSFEKFVLNFEAGSSVINQDLKIFLSNSGSVYLDNVSFTQAYDYYITAKLLPRQGQAVTTKRTTIASYSNGPGFVLTNHLYFFRDNVTAKQITIAIPESTGIWYDGSLLYDRTHYGRAYKNNELVGTDIEYNNIGKLILNASFDIGYGYGSLSADAQIGPLQIIRFVNIGQSNFDPTTHRIGQVPTGGGAEVVAYYDWKGATDLEILTDKSGNGNNLTGNNVTLSDRIKGVS